MSSSVYRCRWRWRRQPLLCHQCFQRFLQKTAAVVDLIGQMAIIGWLSGQLATADWVIGQLVVADRLIGQLPIYARQGTGGVVGRETLERIICGVGWEDETFSLYALVFVRAPPPPVLLFVFLCSF